MVTPLGWRKSTRKLPKHFVSAKIDEQKTEETKQKVIALAGKL